MERVQHNSRVPSKKVRTSSTRVPVKDRVMDAFLPRPRSVHPTVAVDLQSTVTVQKNPRRVATLQRAHLETKLKCVETFHTSTKYQSANRPNKGMIPAQTSGA